MPDTATIDSTQIHSLLANTGYDVSDDGPNVLTVRQVETGVTVQAVLQGQIIFFSLTCLTVATEKLTSGILRKMLDAENGISTSHFQLYDTGKGETAVALSNFCKLQDLGADDEDDILSCVHFLFVDVLAARTVLAGLL